MKLFNFMGILLFMTAVNGQIFFSNVTGEAGMDYNISGEGVCIFDYDNDGLEDVFICDRNNGSNLLFHNLGNMEFEEVSFAVGITISSDTRLVLAGDYTNDGWLDLFIGVLSGNSVLYKNNGDGTFSDGTNESGIVTSGGIRGGAWNDVDSDGWIDLYVGRLTEPNYLFKNNGDGTFTDIAESINAAGPQSNGLVMGLGFFDYNHDGNDDIFMAQDNNRGNILLQKENNGTFADVSAQTGVMLPVMGMGVAFGDFNRDGWTDVYTSNLYENSLLVNSPEGHFDDIATQAGVGDTPGSMAWGTFFFDSDNDGWLDIFNNNQSGFGNIPNSLFHNLGNGSFEDLSEASGLQSYNEGIGCAYGDLDNDGDLDMVAAGHSSVEGSILLYRNDSQSTNHWVQFSLQSTVGDPFAIGAKITLFSPGGLQSSQVAAGNGYCSQNTFRQHFGLGNDSVDSLVVRWPNGDREIWMIPEVNQRYLLVQRTGSATPLAIDSPMAKEFTLSLNIYPNPFNPVTAIRIKGLETGEKTSVTIYNISGRLVESFIIGKGIGGVGEVSWNAEGFPSGIYLVKVQSKNRSLVKKCILTK